MVNGSGILKTKPERVGATNPNSNYLRFTIYYLLILLLVAQCIGSTNSSCVWANAAINSHI